MLKSVVELVNAYWKGKKSAKRGNHRMERTNDGANFYYHNNLVCKLVNGNITLDACGYDGYSSTTRTLNTYRNIFN